MSSTRDSYKKRASIIKNVTKMDFSKNSKNDDKSALLDDTGIQTLLSEILTHLSIFI